MDAKEIELHLKDENSVIKGPPASAEEKLEYEDNASPNTIPANQYEHYVGTSPFGLEILTDTTQVLIHTEKLRLSKVISETSKRQLEVIDDSGRVLFHIEEEETEFDSPDAFKFRLYNRNLLPVMEVLCPSSSTCLCCHSSWHCLGRCSFQAIIYVPLGCVASFVCQAHTCFVHEFEILDPSEQPLLKLRGALNDLEIKSADYSTELGRLSQRGWVGTMHEMRKSRQDWGITFPIDLDIRLKAALIGMTVCLDWLKRKVNS